MVINAAPASYIELVKLLTISQVKNRLDGGTVGTSGGAKSAVALLRLNELIGLRHTLTVPPTRRWVATNAYCDEWSTRTKNRKGMRGREKRGEEQMFGKQTNAQ